MNYPFRHKGNHTCEGVALTCVDFRFWNETVDFIKNELGIKEFDFPSIPGATKAINENSELALKCIVVPCDLHHARKIVLINHQDCGAYGGLQNFNNDKLKEREFHITELRKAKEIILAKYPDREVIMVFASLNDNEEIEFLIIQ